MHCQPRDPGALTHSRGSVPIDETGGRCQIVGCRHDVEGDRVGGVTQIGDDLLSTKSMKNERVVAGLRDHHAVAEIHKGQIAGIGWEVLGGSVGIIKSRLFRCRRLERSEVTVWKRAVTENLPGLQRYVGA